MEKNLFLFQYIAGNPERGRLRYLAHSGSQSQRKIRFVASFLDTMADMMS